MESIKSVIRGQPIIALAIILVLLLVVIFIGAKSGVQRFVKQKTGKALNEDEEKAMDKMIDEIHEIQKT